MMDSFTHYWKNWTPSSVLRALILGMLLSGPGFVGNARADNAPQAQVQPEASYFVVERSDDELQLSTQLQFELPPVVEDALTKGIPLSFVMFADVLRERWYWYDKRMAGAQRHFRLAFQPLSRRWRLNVSSGGNAVGLALNQSFDTLGQALAAIKRVSKWKIADVSELDGAPRCRVEYHFKLDLSQLPRPFQLGAVGPTEWDIAVAAQTQVSLESVK